MKRNDIFMWAYITFVFFCIVLRMLWAFQLWGAVVLAITISSMFFAVEDLCSSMARFLKDSCDIADSFISTARKEVSKDLEFLSAVDQKADTYKDKEYDLSDVKMSYNPIRNSITQMAIYLDSFEKKIVRKKEQQKKCQKYANIMAYLGFLCLFCVLVISSAGTVPVLDQEIITVLAFGVILVTQQINTYSEKKIKKDIVDSEKALQAQREARESMLKSEDNINYLCSLVERLNELEDSEEIEDPETEATDNAD